MSEFIDELKSEAVDTAAQSKEALLHGMDAAKDVLSEGKSCASSNPVPYIAGALAVGIVIGLLIPREKPNLSVLDGRIDELKDLLGSLKTRVSSTAEERYGDVSAAIGDVVKKARKRFNLS